MRFPSDVPYYTGRDLRAGAQGDLVRSDNFGRVGGLCGPGPPVLAPLQHLAPQHQAFTLEWDHRWHHPKPDKETEDAAVHVEAFSSQPEGINSLKGQWAIQAQFEANKPEDEDVLTLGELEMKAEATRKLREPQIESQANPCSNVPYETNFGSKGGDANSNGKDDLSSFINDDSDASRDHAETDEDDIDTIERRLEEEKAYHSLKGYVYLSTWQLQPNLSIQYAIRFKDAQPSRGQVVQVADVFVSLDQAIRLLTSCGSESGTVRVKPPNIKTIWTIRVEEKDLDFCPLSEFVYHSALKASGKKFKAVYEGILSEIIKNLYNTEAAVNSSSLLTYVEKNYSVNDYNNGFGGNKKDSVNAISSVQDELYSNWDNVESLFEQEFQTEENGNVKLEDVKKEKVNEDRDWDSDYEDVSGKSKSRKKRKTASQKKTHACQLCDKIFNSPLRLQRHVDQTHPEGKDAFVEKPSEANVKDENRLSDPLEDPSDEGIYGDVAKFERVGNYKCKECNKPFIRLLILINHCKREHPDNPDICPPEPLKLGLLETLHERIPERSVSGEELFRCGLALCNMTFSRYLSLVDHERTHIEAYICILCGVPCESAAALIAHSDTQHPRKSEFICRVCGFYTRRADNLKTHVQQEHMHGAVTWQCEECPYTTEKKQSLHNHKRTMHMNREFFCDICGKNYASGASLYVHKKSHDPNFKKFKCKLCPAKFAYSSGLTYHMAVHTGEKPFSCNQCGQTFGSHTALSRHIKVIHAEEKDMIYQCEHCGKKFSKRLGREYHDHLKVHTGERDHICSICGSGYFSRKMLRKHELKKHLALLPKKAPPVRINPDNVPAISIKAYGTLPQTNPGPKISEESLQIRNPKGEVAFAEINGGHNLQNADILGQSVKKELLHVLPPHVHHVEHLQSHFPSHHS